MSTVKLECKECHKEFDITQKEYRRQTKAGRDHKHFFCSRSCVTKYNNKNRPPEVQEKISRALSNRPKTYKETFTKVVRRTLQRKWDNNLTETYIETMWKTQKGKCALSGIDMVISKWKERNTPYTVSIDRIDSSKGYYANNVQLVCYSMNIAKNNFSNEDFLSFVAEIKRR